MTGSLHFVTSRNQLFAIQVRDICPATVTSKWNKALQLRRERRILQIDQASFRSSNLCSCLNSLIPLVQLLSPGFLPPLLPPFLFPHLDPVQEIFLLEVPIFPSVLQSIFQPILSLYIPTLETKLIMSASLIASEQ